jgi:hypothetical protein
MISDQRCLSLAAIEHGANVVHSVRAYVSFRRLRTCGRQGYVQDVLPDRTLPNRKERCGVLLHLNAGLSLIISGRAACNDS